MRLADGDQGPNQEQSLKAVEDALLRNHRTWDQLPQGYKDVLSKGGYEPATFNQTELARNGTTDVTWSLEDPFNKAYWSVTGGIIGYESAPLVLGAGNAAIQKTIIACLVNPACQQIIPKAYASRLESQTDPFHDFPRLLDPIIMKFGNTELNPPYINYSIPGSIEYANKIYNGIYQIGIELEGWVPTIVHHFFKPN